MSIHLETVKQFKLKPSLVDDLLKEKKKVSSDKMARKVLRKKRDAWEVLTRRNQDIGDEFINKAPLKDVLGHLEWYESDDAYISMAPWLVMLAKRLLLDALRNEQRGGNAEGSKVIDDLLNTYDSQVQSISSKVAELQTLDLLTFSSLDVKTKLHFVKEVFRRIEAIDMAYKILTNMPVAFHNLYVTFSSSLSQDDKNKILGRVREVIKAHLANRKAILPYIDTLLCKLSSFDKYETMFIDLKNRIAQQCLFLKRNFAEDSRVIRGAGSCFAKPAVDELDNIDNMTIEELQALQDKLDQEFEQRKMEQQKINELLEKSQFNSISDEELMKELEGLQGGRKRAKKPLKKGTQ